jgi:hypothetical protein
MAAKKTTLNELGDMLTHVVKHMATKDDIAQLDKRIDKLDAKIDSVRSCSRRAMARCRLTTAAHRPGPWCSLW